jgi:hypothetical protein
MQNALAESVPGRFLTLPMAGFAAADAAGAVNNYDTGRFLPILDHKSGELYLSPDRTDGYVYNDEYIAYMVNTHGWRDAVVTAPSGLNIGGITGWFLGSEPETVSAEFPSLNLSKLTASELVNAAVSAASAVKMIDPSADVFAPGIKNLESYINLSNNTDWENYSDEYSWFIDYFLDSMKKAGGSDNGRLLDCLDLHLYTEATTSTGTYILRSSTDSANKVRLEAPRLLWDPEYSEASRAGATYRAYTPLLPTLQASIRMYYPGTKLSFSEYAYGGGDNVTGGIAVADTIGLFAENGVYMAGLSPSVTPEYEYAGLSIYTDYDGYGSGFLPVSVFSETNDPDTAVYSAVGEKNDSILTAVFINRSESEKDVQFLLNAGSDYDNVRIFGFDRYSHAITERTEEGGDLVTGNSYIASMPPLSVMLFEFSGEPRPGGETITVTTSGSQTESLQTTAADTDEYGVTITELTTTAPTASEAKVTVTASSPETTVIAPENQPADNVPVIIKIIGLALLAAVISVMAYIIYRILRR